MLRLAFAATIIALAIFFYVEWRKFNKLNRAKNLRAEAEIDREARRISAEARETQNKGECEEIKTMLATPTPTPELD